MKRTEKESTGKATGKSTEKATRWILVKTIHQNIL